MSYPDLVKPFSARFIKDDGRGNSYVEHGIVLQRIILATGRPPHIEIVRELYDEGQLTGVLMRMTAFGYEPVEEFGEADNPQAKTNGARAKSAASDAIKRCAMRLGVGLHLWVGDANYLLFEKSAGSEQSEPHPEADIPSGSPHPGFVEVPPPEGGW